MFIFIIIQLSSHAYEEKGKWVGCAWAECCDNKLRFPSKLREHLRLHTGEKAVACPSCGNNFVTRAKVSRHMKNVSNHINLRPLLTF